MAYTNLDITLRVIALYLTFLVIVSIYQAISPTSPHNKVEIVDHGAQLLQDGFKDLRIQHPRFDYSVQTVNQMLLQMMLMVTMRYNVNTAIYMSLGIGLVLIAVIFVAGKMLAQVIMMVFGLAGLMSHTIWSPLSLVMGIIELVGPWLSFSVAPLICLGSSSSRSEAIFGRNSARDDTLGSQPMTLRRRRTMIDLSLMSDKANPDQITDSEGTANRSRLGSAADRSGLQRIFVLLLSPPPPITVILLILTIILGRTVSNFGRKGQWKIQTRDLRLDSLGAQV
jgi:hypothetical protein